MSALVQPLFLLSLPRSGSTLLQRMLAAHPEIATASEPHLLLPFLYSTRKRGVCAEYGQQLVAQGIEEFCRELPGGEGDYWREVEGLTLRLYTRAAGEGARYFLDKTPRYSLVVEDIMRIFRDGRFVVLVRNPLAIIASMLETFKAGRWCAYAFNADLFSGLPNLIEACRTAGDRLHLVRYEELVRDPHAQCRALCRYLGVSAESGQPENFVNVQIKGLGDQKGIRNYHSVSREPLDKWREILANPLRKRWCRRYLRWIGAERLRIIGYDLDQLLAELGAVPFSLERVGSDCLRMPFGVLYRALEPKLMQQKLALLPHWHQIHAHY